MKTRHHPIWLLALGLIALSGCGARPPILAQIPPTHPISASADSILLSSYGVYSGENFRSRRAVWV